MGILRTAAKWAIGGATLAGTVGGSLYGAFDKNGDAGAGAAVGAAVGAVSLPVAAAATYGIGTAAIYGAKNLDKVGEGVFSAARGLRTAGAALGAGAMHPYGPIARWGGAATKLLGNMVEYIPEKQVFNQSKNILEKTGGKFKLKPLGWGVLGAGAAVGAVGDMWSKSAEYHMGQIDNEMTRATPRLPSYMDNAGASGDLVFAMNANRRG